MECYCDHGLICDVHPRKPAAHANCQRPGTRCVNADCRYGLAHLVASWLLVDSMEQQLRQDLVDEEQFQQAFMPPLDAPAPAGH